MSKEKFCSNCGKELDKSGVCAECGNQERFIKDGVIDRKKLKAKAKEMLSKDFFNLLKPVLVSFLISFVLGFILGCFVSESSPYYSIISAFLEFLLIPMNAGLTLYYLNYIRGKEFNLKDLFNYYDGKVWIVWGSSILLTIFVSLWTLLFIIPGIIAVFAYSQYIYILVDNEEYHSYEVLKKSKEMMYGYKSNYFVFVLSFIGWYLLVGITFGIASIYVLPYVNICNTLYYEELRKIKSE